MVDGAQKGVCVWREVDPGGGWFQLEDCTDEGWVLV